MADPDEVEDENVICNIIYSLQDIVFKLFSNMKSIEDRYGALYEKNSLTPEMTAYLRKLHLRAMDILISAKELLSMSHEYTYDDELKYALPRGYTPIYKDESMRRELQERMYDLHHAYPVYTGMEIRPKEYDSNTRGYLRSPERKELLKQNDLYHFIQDADFSDGEEEA